jgi:dipeptidyl aminopeptidase/acylaminoacyl peptidase
VSTPGAEGGGGQGRGGAGRGGQGRGGGQGAAAAAGAPAAPQVRVSPDRRFEALIQNYNIYLRPVGGRADDARPLSWDGSEGNAYTFNSITWSPDSKKIAALRRRPGYTRVVTYVRSSPVDQLQPSTMTQSYRKPGDVVDFDQPVLFDIEPARQRPIDPALFPNPYSNGRLEWRSDSRSFTFEYNQRGHQLYRVIEVDAATAAARTVIEETSKTFVDYRRTAPAMSDSGRVYRFDVADGKEIIWMSERDGWSHLYLYDGVTGRVKNQITKGDWKVHHVELVDPEKRQIWFTANGMEPGKDPYFLKSYRIGFDGTGLTSFTPGDGTHAVSWSPDRSYYVDTYQRVDQPPIVELRRASDQQVVLTLERTDMSELTATGWRPPEVFVAKGRDGQTDIWGIIIRPTNFDPKRRYPVIENIYAGPQGSFVPKTFSTQLGMQSLAELGFIVVQIDGMGTANRSKAFHEVAWKNLGDAGFPDRILWHKAVAAKYSYYDATRVGLYGTSAGGQNAMGGLLFHPEFYKAAAASSGCHDNRMDKIWWNEQWMGWPLGPEYAASSNMEHAGKLQGALLLIVGELDTNVDPSSTMQVVNKLIQANKDFDLLVIPNGGHTNGGAYGDRRRYDFFVRHLQGRTPPSWNALPPPNTGGGTPGVGLLDEDALPWVRSEDWQ